MPPFYKIKKKKKKAHVLKMDEKENTAELRLKLAVPLETCYLYL